MDQTNQPSNQPSNESKRSVAPYKAAINSISDIGLGPRATQILEYVFDHPELSQKEIAKDMGVSPNRISTIMNHKRVIAAFPLLGRKRISNMLPKALSRFSTLMNQNDNLEVSRKVTESVLKNEKVIDNTQHYVVKNQFEMMRPEELADIVKRAKLIDGNDIIQGELVENDQSEPA
jgi:plasmid maintenance system antidote protein VapI